MIIRRSIPEGTSDRYREGEFSKDYNVLNELGRGRFAVVRRCEHVATRQHFAAKFIRKRRMGRDCKEDILKEIKILEMSTDHPRLISLHEIYETPHDVILVLEFATGGELHPYCVAERDGSFTERDAVRLLLQIVEGIKYLHDQDIVHLDIKPQNILLTSEEITKGDIKLIDFGIARWLNKDQEVRDIVGTVDYVAPEVLNYEPISLATDMWSVGVVAYVMLTGVSPFAGDTKQETYLNISQGDLDFPEEYFKDVSLEAQDLIKSLCVLEPEERLTVDECIEHSLFAKHQMECSLHPLTMDRSDLAVAVDMSITESDAVDQNNVMHGVFGGSSVESQHEGQSKSPGSPPTSTNDPIRVNFRVRGHLGEESSELVSKFPQTMELNARASESDADLEAEQHKMQIDHQHNISTSMEVSGASGENVFAEERTVHIGQGSVVEHVDSDTHAMSNGVYTFGQLEPARVDFSAPSISIQCPTSSKSLSVKLFEPGREGCPNRSLKHPLHKDGVPGGHMSNGISRGTPNKAEGHKYHSPSSSPFSPRRVLDKENMLSDPEPKRPKMETAPMVMSS